MDGNAQVRAPVRGSAVSPMNIYFSCSITGGRQDEIAYQAIVDTLLADGHEVPTASLASAEVLALEDLVDPVEVYTRDVAWIDSCEAVVAEVSTPSHGVGYEIAYALSMSKPVLCLYKRGQTISKMILGNTHATLTIRTYQTPEEASQAVRAFILSLKTT
jgi:nucleoside 2-deoxyribosyltransferase